MIPLYCSHGISIQFHCSSCPSQRKDPIAMPLQEELNKCHATIDRWRAKLHAAIQENNLEDASFYARAVGNEYEMVSRLLHDEWKRGGS